MVSLRPGKRVEFAPACHECLDIDPQSDVRYGLNMYEGPQPAERPPVEPEAAG